MLSHETSVHRYVELHEQPLAAVFTHNGFVRYSAQIAVCPYRPLQRGRPTLLAAQGDPVPPMSEIVPVDPALAAAAHRHQRDKLRPTSSRHSAACFG